MGTVLSGIEKTTKDNSCYHKGDRNGCFIGAVERIPSFETLCTSPQSFARAEQKMRMQGSLLTISSNCKLVQAARDFSQSAFVATNL